MMKDDDFKLLRGFADGWTDICDCRVAFATEKKFLHRLDTIYNFTQF